VLSGAISAILARRDLTLPAPGDLLVDFAAASRRAGRKPLVLEPSESASLAAAGVDWPLAERADDLLRIALLLRAPIDAAGVAELFRSGDNDERRAILRALPVLPSPPEHVALAVDACRTNVVPIFEAIACENPFPTRHFPELHFQQMVLKAVFLGVRLPRVLGLAARVTPELARMADDYAAERRAAGRVVPEDLALIALPAERIP
jgi:hypothetical protein